MIKSHYKKEKTYAHLSVGDSVRIAREMQKMTQCELAEACGTTQATISAIENGHVNLGVERAKRLAIVLDVHPSVLLFADWESERKKIGA